jgi:hypothetical protein
MPRCTPPQPKVKTADPCGLAHAEPIRVFQSDAAPKRRASSKMLSRQNGIRELYSGPKYEPIGSRNQDLTEMNERGEANFVVVVVAVVGGQNPTGGANARVDGVPTILSYPEWWARRKRRLCPPYAFG